MDVPVNAMWRIASVTVSIGMSGEGFTAMDRGHHLPQCLKQVQRAFAMANGRGRPYRRGHVLLCGDGRFQSRSAKNQVG